MNWPTTSGEFKVVQANIDDLVQHGFSSEPHAVILATLLEQNGRYTERYGGKYSAVHDRMLPSDFTGKKYETMIDPSVPRLELKIPKPSGENYAVLGMGKVSIDQKSRTATVHGSSISYGFVIDKAALDKLQEMKPDWKISS